MTITLCGSIDDCRLAQSLIQGIDRLQVDRASDPLAVADGTGRYRIYLAVTL